MSEVTLTEETIPRRDPVLLIESVQGYLAYKKTPPRMTVQ
jgi:hypothetical protein